MLSPPVGTTFLNIENATEFITNIVYEECKCEINDSDCLKNLRTYELFKCSSQARITIEQANLNQAKSQQVPVIAWSYGFAPIIDKVIVKKVPILTNFSKSVIIGSTGDEFETKSHKIFDGGRGRLPEKLARGWYDLIIAYVFVDARETIVEEIQPILDVYPFTRDCDRFHGNRTDDNECDGKDALNLVFRDFLYVCAQKKWLRLNTPIEDSSKKSFLYYFNEPAGFLPETESEFGPTPFSRCSYMACHGSDVPYLLGLHDYFQQVEITPDQFNLAMVEQGYFSSFIQRVFVRQPRFGDF